MKQLVVATAVMMLMSLEAVELRSDEYRAQKRAIHEQKTGERLDEDGRLNWAMMAKNNAASSMRSARLLAASAPLVVSNVKMKQRDNSKLVDITYDLTGGSGNRCRVSFEICDDKTCIRVKVQDGVSPGKGLNYTWDAGSEWPDKFSTKVNVKITAEEINVPVDWADIYVQWDSFGGQDLDICGYWVDAPTVKVGWSWGSGTEKVPYQSKWFGDDVDKGPEHIIVKADGNGISSRKYRVHFNYYGAMGSPCKAKVVVSNNGITLTETQNASKKLGYPADTGSPCITITFDESGTPVAIKKGN